MVLNSLGNARKVDYFRKNQIIFSPELDTRFLNVKDGLTAVPLVVTSRQGKEAVIEVLNGGSFLLP